MIYQKKADGTWTTCAEYMGTVGDQTINGNLSIIGGKDLFLGGLGQEKYCSLNVKRRMFNEEYETTFGIGGFLNKGNTQIAINKIENGVSKYQNRFLFRSDCFHPEVRANLGCTSNPFYNGYFKSSVFIGSDSTLNADTNGYGIFNFKSNDNSMRYGFLGKGVAGTNDMHFRAEQGNLFLTANGQGNIYIGQTENCIYTHFGAKTWRLAPAEKISGIVNLGSTTERFKQLYTTTTPNVSSDKNLKENIKYIDDINTLSSEEVITKDNCYDFVKDELRLAEYNMKNDEEKNVHLGFIAQDLEGKKVGDKIVSKDENGLLSYNMGNYTSVLTLALQKAMEKIEKLELEIENLKNN